MLPSLILVPLLLAAAPVSSAEQAKEAVQQAANAPLVSEGEPRYAQPTPMDVLEYSSKLTDTAGTVVSFAAYVLGGMAILVAGGTFYYQWRVQNKIDEAAKAAVEKVSKILSEDQAFLDVFTEAMLRQKDFQTYIKTTVEQIVRATAAEIITEDYIKTVKEAAREAANEAAK